MPWARRTISSLPWIVENRAECSDRSVSRTDARERAVEALDVGVVCRDGDVEVGGRAASPVDLSGDATHDHELDAVPCQCSQQLGLLGGKLAHERFGWSSCWDSSTRKPGTRAQLALARRRVGHAQEIARMCDTDAGAVAQLDCPGGAAEIAVAVGAGNVGSEHERSALGQRPGRPSVDVAPALVRVGRDEAGVPHLGLHRIGIAADELDPGIPRRLRSSLQYRGNPADAYRRRAPVGQPAKGAKRAICRPSRHETTQPLGRCELELVGDELLEAGIPPGQMDDQSQPTTRGRVLLPPWVGSWPEWARFGKLGIVAAASGESVRHRYHGLAMTVDETPAGTLVVDFTEKEYDDYLEGEVRRGTGLTVAEFVRAYEAGELDDADPAVSDLVGLLRIGQNGDRAA